MGVGRHDLRGPFRGRGGACRPGGDVLQPLEDDLVAAVGSNVQRAAGGARRRRVGGPEVGAAVHAVPVHRYDDEFGRRAFCRAAGSGELEGLLEGAVLDPVDGPMRTPTRATGRPAARRSTASRTPSQ